MAGVQIDGVNNKIDFDDDLDTSISANTDDTLVIEAGGNTMATITATTFTINDGTTITTADNTDTLTLISTDADALVGPNLNFYRNSSSPADGDLMGQIKFTGESAGSGIHTYGSIVMENNGVTDGQEQGKIKFNISMPDGALANVFNIDRTEICINEDSEDLDFRVESNANTHMLFVDGGNNRISMGDESPSNCGAIVTVSSGDSGATVNGTWDAFCIEGGGSRGMSILTPNNQTGAIVFGDPDDNDVGKFQYSHAENSMTFVVNATEALRISTSQVLSTGGEDGPDATNGGITIDTNAEDGAAFTFKNSDVAHGITDNAQTDTYFQIKKSDNAKGGVFITSLAEDMASERMVITANGDGDLSTTKSASGRGAITIGANTKSGTGVTYVNDDGNLLTIANYTQTNFIFDAEGTFHSNVGTATYDEYDDAQLVRAMDLSTSTKGLIASRFDDFVKYNHEDLAAAKIVGREEDGTPNSMVNWTAMSQLHNGAIWQQYEKTQRLTQAMYKLAVKTLGKEEADKLLDEEEIKLLN